MSAYCSKSCQVAHYKAGHKRVCKLIPGNSSGNATLNQVDAARKELESAMDQVTRMKIEADRAREGFNRVAGVSPSQPSPSPQTSAPDYSQKSYWNDAYKQNVRYNENGDDTYDWYNNYKQTATVFSEIFGKDTGTVVDIGCGNSTLLQSLLTNRIIENGIGVDLSDVLISSLNSKLIQTLQQPPPPIKFICSDVTVPWSDAPFLVEDNSLSGCIDKGTLDAILSHGGGSNKADNVTAMDSAKSMIQNALLALKPQSHLLIFSNLPQSLALPFFAESTPHVEAIASFEPNSRKPVKIGFFVKAAMKAQTVTIYKLTSDEKENSEKSIEQKMKVSFVPSPLASTLYAQF